MTGTDHWARATAGLPAPLVAVDLDAFDANADDLVRRAAGLPIRVATKSVRCRTLLDRVLAPPRLRRRHVLRGARGGLAGGSRGCATSSSPTPRSTRPALRAVATDDLPARRGDGHDRLRRARALAARHPRRDVAGLGVALDVDASLRVGRVHLGVRRSPTRAADQALAVVRAALGVGLDVRGVMFYDAQIAGLPDAGRASG